MYVGSNLDVAASILIAAGKGALEMNQNEIRNGVVQNLSVAPSALPGQIYYDTAFGKLGIRNASAFYYPDMQMSVYDTNGDGYVDHADWADTLEGYHGAWYQLRDNHTGTQLASTISNFDEAAQDAVGAMLVNTNSITLAYTDSTPSITATLRLVAGGGLETVAGGVQLADVGTAGTYFKVTTNGKGQVTSGVATLSASDLPTHTHTSTDVTDFYTAVRSNRLDQFAAPTASVNLNNQKITNLADPTAASDAATKGYVDNAIAGYKWKNSVKCATTANITLSGTSAIDGVTIAVGDRVLVKNQTTTSQNGIYIVASGAWSRSADGDAWAEYVSAAVFVEQGTTNGDTGWLCTVDAGGTLGTTAIAWTQFNGMAALVAGNGLSKTGNQIDVNVDGQSMEISADALQVKILTNGGLSKSASGLGVNVDNTTVELYNGNIRIKGYYAHQKNAWTITGDGTTTTFTVTHSFNNSDVEVKVKEASTNEHILVDTAAPTANTVTVSFRWPPANGKQYRVTVIA